MPDIRILIAEDHPIVRKGLRLLLAGQPGMQVVAEAANGLEAVELAGATQPDVILMDLLMPIKDGLTAIQEIRQKQPRQAILVLTSFAEDGQIIPAIQAGALGYLLKDSTPEELVQAIQDVHAGRPVLNASIALKLMLALHKPVSGSAAAGQPALGGLPQLTGREVEVLKLVAAGLTNQEIASQLVVSERTVGTHISNILEKLGLENRTQAALYALRQGLASLYP